MIDVYWQDTHQRVIYWKSPTTFSVQDYRQAVFESIKMIESTHRDVAIIIDASHTRNYPLGIMGVASILHSQLVHFTNLQCVVIVGGNDLLWSMFQTLTKLPHIQNSVFLADTFSDANQIIQQLQQDSA